jgi:hypothetical protein
MVTRLYLPRWSYLGTVLLRNTRRSEEASRNFRRWEITYKAEEAMKNVNTVYCCRKVYLGAPDGVVCLTYQRDND